MPIRIPREKDTKADNFLERMVNSVHKGYLHKETSLLFHVNENSLHKGQGYELGHCNVNVPRKLDILAAMVLDPHYIP